VGRLGPISTFFSGGRDHRPGLDWVSGDSRCARRPLVQGLRPGPSRPHSLSGKRKSCSRFDGGRENCYQKQEERKGPARQKAESEEKAHCSKKRTRRKRARAEERREKNKKKRRREKRGKKKKGEITIPLRSLRHGCRMAGAMIRHYLRGWGTWISCKEFFRHRGPRRGEKREGDEKGGGRGEGGEGATEGEGERGGGERGKEGGLFAMFHAGRGGQGGDSARSKKKRRKQRRHK